LKQKNNAKNPVHSSCTGLKNNNFAFKIKKNIEMKKLTHYLFVLLILLSSCSLDEIKNMFSEKNDFSRLADSLAAIKKQQTYDSLITENKEVAPEVRIPYDTLKSDMSKIIGGLQPEKYYLDYAVRDFYKKHTQMIDLEWAKVKTDNLEPISIWTINQSITSPVDSATIFYPFSGPDFLYAYQFFPFSKNYVLIGLENEGSIPNLYSLHDTLVNNYLDGVRYSMRFINKVGYFVTSQMNKDFSEKYLNGVSHILYFYIARSGLNVVDYQHFYLDSNGEMVAMSDDEHKPGKVTGVQIKLIDNQNQSLKNLYYFKVNLQDGNMQNKAEFYSFMEHLGKFNTYIKSASYILHDVNFQNLRTYILSNSEKILQDDTGVPFSYFANSKFDLQLFGKYSRTISDFKNHFQPALAAELKKQNNDDLPFRIGYNAWFDETLLMYAQTKGTENKNVIAENTKPIVEKKKETTTKQNLKMQPTNTDNGIVFKVQFLISGELHDLKSDFFKEIPSAGFYTENGVYKYTAGNEKTAEKATQIKNAIRANGYADAFLVAFKKGKRIDVQEAIKQTK